ncbi:folate-binding protein YgfZ [soil metagenome]
MILMEDFENSTTSQISHGAEEYTRFAGHSVPAHYGDPAAEYATLTESAVIVDRSYKAVLKLDGKDPAGLLKAVLTNDVPPGDSLGAYAALLDPKGHVQTDLRLLKSGESILVDTEPEGAEAARNILGRYAPFSQVKIQNLDSWGILGLYGPWARDLLGLPLNEHETAVANIDGEPILTAGVLHPSPGYDLIGPTDLLKKVRQHLVTEGAMPIGIHAYETVRVEAGTPRFGADITSENFPAEAGILDRAVSFAKGCYPGQETVARMHYRGHPNRSLHHLLVEDEPPQPGTGIFQNAKQVGKITSVAPLPVNDQTLALGYLHRNADLDSSLVAADSVIVPQPLS